jgi:hypothetical protein
MSLYSDRIQMTNEEGTWCKFRQIDGNWDILLSHDSDPQSLEIGSSAHHVHYWQREGNWYVQSKVNGSHTIGRDYLINQINENGDNSLNRADTRDLADSISDRVYGSGGYDSSENIHGIEVESDYHAMLDNYVSEYQSAINSPSNPSRINWREDDDSVITTLPKLNPNRIIWKNNDNLSTDTALEPDLSRINWIDNETMAAEESDSNSVENTSANIESSTTSTDNASSSASVSSTSSSSM